MEVQLTAIVSENRIAVLASGFSIVSETPDLAPARERLLDCAMGPGRRRKSSENLRRGRLPADGLAFAALNGDGELAGTVRLWDILAGAGQNGVPVRALLLGPLAVDPALTGCGIGSALIRHAIGKASAAGHGAIILVGDAPYYGRFGFSAERTAALIMPGPVERERFLALELTGGHLEEAAGLLMASGRRMAAHQTSRLAA